MVPVYVNTILKITRRFKKPQIHSCKIVLAYKVGLIICYLTVIYIKQNYYDMDENGHYNYI